MLNKSIKAAFLLLISSTPVAGFPLVQIAETNPLQSYHAASSLPLDNFKSFIESFFSSYLHKPEPSEIYIDDGIQSIYHLNETTDENFESWIDDQYELSFSRILENIGGVGTNLQNVSDGAVIASPSKSKPNYFYQWVRDAAITVNSIVEYLNDNIDDLESSYSKKLFFAIESYIANNYKLQRLDNKSGTWESLDSLGEPKFMPDTTTFDEHWGRPQRDGPGLRVITIINYLNFLENNDLDVLYPNLIHNVSFVYNEILKPDLTYVINKWDKDGFDLWEEIDSIHLFTSLTMLKSLKMGIKLSEAFEDYEFNLRLRTSFTALRLYILLDSGFKVPNIPFLIETPSLVAEAKRCGLDIGSILASLRAHDLDDPTDIIDIPFSVDDSSVLSTLAALVTDMKYRYPINHADGTFNKGFAIGRYPEDLYDGLGISEGNPWFIATATSSELLFKLVYYLYYHNKDLVITNDQFSFYSNFISLDPNTKSEKVILPFGSDAFVDTTLSLMKYADAFLEVIQEHVDADGHMSEQFNKYTGYMEGAEDLTWSYGSFWSAVRWRKRAQWEIDHNV